MSSGPHHETYQLLGCEPERLCVLYFSSSSGKRWMYTSPWLWGGRSECKSPLRGCLLSRRHQRTHDLRSRADIPESLLKPVSTSDKGSCPLSCSSDCNDADGTLSDMSCSNSG